MVGMLKTGCWMNGNGMEQQQHLIGSGGNDLDKLLLAQQKQLSAQQPQQSVQPHNGQNYMHMLNQPNGLAGLNSATAQAHAHQQQMWLQHLIAQSSLENGKMGAQVGAGMGPNTSNFTATQAPNGGFYGFSGHPRGAQGGGAFASEKGGPNNVFIFVPPNQQAAQQWGYVMGSPPSPGQVGQQQQQHQQQLQREQSGGSHPHPHPHHHQHQMQMAAAAHAQVHQPHGHVHHQHHQRQQHIRQHHQQQQQQQQQHIQALMQIQQEQQQQQQQQQQQLQQVVAAKEKFQQQRNHSRKTNRRQALDPNDPNPRKRPRKSYTDEDKQRIVKADAEGGRPRRLQVARELGMPARTADKIITRARLKLANATHDARHDREHHKGRNTKATKEVSNIFKNILAMHATFTLEQLRVALNAELLRVTLKSRNIALTKEEEDRHAPLNPGRYFQIAGVKSQCENLQVKSGQTVGNWLESLICSRKHTLQRNDLGNSETLCSQRKSFAERLLPHLEQESSIPVFFADFPYYLALSNMSPTDLAGLSDTESKLNARCAQVTIAVVPGLGIVHHQVYQPDKLVQVQTGSKKQSWLPVWSKERFDAFVTTTLDKLDLSNDKIKSLVLLTEEIPPLYAGEGSQKLDDRNILQLPKIKEIQSKYPKLSVQNIVMPINTPQINICEWYGRTIGDVANDDFQENHKETSLITNDDFETLITRATEMTLGKTPLDVNELQNNLKEAIENEGIYKDLYQPFPTSQ